MNSAATGLGGTVSSPPKLPLPPCPGLPGGRVEPLPIDRRKNTVPRAVDVRGKSPFPPSLLRDEDEDSDVDPTLFGCQTGVLGRRKRSLRGDPGLAVSLS